MKLVVVQLDTQWEDRPANHQRVQQQLKNVEIPKGSLVVLPEMFDVGFSMNVEATRPDSSNTSERFLIQLADEYQSAFVAGVVGTDEKGNPANLAVGYAPDGTNLVRYRKMQPFTPMGEDRHYGIGDEPCLFDWQGTKIAPFICYDLRFPENFREAVRRGAEMIVVIACWPAVRSEHWLRLLQARAIENQAIVAGVNRCGTDPNVEYQGLSVIYDPQGHVVWSAESDEVVGVVDVDTQAISQWRDAFPALKDMRPR